MLPSLQQAMEHQLYFPATTLGVYGYMNSVMGNGQMANSPLKPGKLVIVGKTTGQASQLCYLFSVIAPAPSCSLEAMMSMFVFIIFKTGEPSWRKRAWGEGYGD